MRSHGLTTGSLPRLGVLVSVIALTHSFSACGDDLLDCGINADCLPPDGGKGAAGGEGGMAGKGGSAGGGESGAGAGGASGSGGANGGVAGSDDGGSAGSQAGGSAGSADPGGTGSTGATGGLGGAAGSSDAGGSGGNGGTAAEGGFAGTGENKWAWVKQAGDIEVDWGHSLAPLADGSIYVTGEFRGSAAFGGGETITAKGVADVFVAKYAAGGRLIWVKQGGGTGTDVGESIATTGDGSAYVTGTFMGSAAFGATTLVADGDIATFLVKYDANGNVLWARRVSGGPNQARGVAVLADGSVCISGSFNISAGFGTITLSAATGDRDLYLVCYDSNGTALWARSAVGLVYRTELATLTDGTFYVVGDFALGLTFGTTILNPIGLEDVFLAKYDSLGNVLWARSAGGPSDDWGRGIATLADGSVYITGHFRESIGFGSTVLNAQGLGDIFVVRYDPNGNVVWAKSAGGPNFDTGAAVTTAADGSVYVTGYFDREARFGSTTLIAKGWSEIFLAKYDSAGNLVWVTSAGGTVHDSGEAVARGADGSLLVTGGFQVDSTFGGITISAVGYTDMFLAKWVEDGTVTKP